MTNDTTPATDQCVFRVSPSNRWLDGYRCKRKSGHGPKGDLCWQHAKPKVEHIPFQFKMDEIKNREIDELKATITQLQSEITALKTALDELLDWVNGERRTSDDRLAEIESMLPSKGEL